MYPQERQEKIISILNQYRYVTVAYLIDALHYSSATINRDLNILEKRGLVKRSYGGVELGGDKGIPVVFRQHKQHAAKERVARCAAELVENGDVIFVDGSTTAQYMASYLEYKEDIRIITNNMTLAAQLSDRGIACICLGGQVLEPPSMLGGPDTVEMARSYQADKAFFSTSKVSTDGTVFDNNTYLELHRVMLENSNECIYLADEHKFEHNNGIKRLCGFDDLYAVISDRDITGLQDKFPSTKLIHA